MKLLTYTSRIQLFFFLVLFGGFSILFYLVLSWNVLQNVDEVLYNRKMNLLAYLKENPRAPFTEDNPLDDFTFYLIDEEAFQKGREIYADTLVYEPVDDELDEYRKLTTPVELHGNYYRLGMTLCYYLSQRVISRKIWNPFYEMLEKLRHYRLDKQVPVLSHSRIDEFRTLRDAITELMQKNKEVFDSQKQFIENASHEMQTPLSVIQSRLEALISQEELKVAQHIEIVIKKEDELIVQGNTMLTEILLQNLLKNAFLHNIKEGKVIISIMKNRLSIANTGYQKALDKEKLFHRFYKQSGNPDTWGLGLAIVHKIAEVSSWDVNYHQGEGFHIFTVLFE